MDISLREFPVAGLAAGAVVSLVRSRSERLIRRRGQRFARRNLAVVEDRFVPALDARFRREELANVVIALVMIAVVLALPAALVEQSDRMWVLCLVVAPAPGIQAALAMWEARRREVVADVPRVARIRSVTVGDYAPIGYRILVWLLTLAAVGLLLGNVAAGDSLAISVLAVMCGSVLLGVLVLVEVSAQWIVRQPEPAKDAAQLYWQDALRGEAINASYQGLMWGGFFVGLGLMGVVPDAALVLCVVALIITLWPLVLEARPPWFRRRLWRGLRQGDVIGPGTVRVSA